MDSEELTPEDQALLAQLTDSYPKGEEKHNIIAFFNNVIKSQDTLRTANLSVEELGNAKVPVRTYRELSCYCDAMGLKGLGNYFTKLSSIITDSSLSREGFLDRLVVTQKRETESKLGIGESPKKNKGWFKKKDSSLEPAPATM